MRSVFQLFYAVVLILPGIVSCASEEEQILTSPDKKIHVVVSLDPEGTASYSIAMNGEVLMKESLLGIEREDADFTSNLTLVGIDSITTIEDVYPLIYGKKDTAHFKANACTYRFQNSDSLEMNVTFLVADDGVAFQYFFPGKSDELYHIISEHTSFNFPGDALSWLQPRASAKSGWNAVNPSYEEHYQKSIPLSEVAPTDTGWVFPALIKTGSYWINITETWPGRNYCGSHLNKADRPGEMAIAFPEPTEGFTYGVVYPTSKLPWATPWRVITIGESLGTIAESTFGMDVSPPNALGDVSYVQPGRAAWSWALEKDASVNFGRQKEFIDYAAEMNWEYCLIDVNWNYTIGWDGNAQLSEYAISLGVGLILWYNSSGGWNTVPFEPQDRLLTREGRQKEFAKLQELGIRGIKVDFFGGDGQSMMNYYLDIFSDAHEYDLMVNCHGATLPRGVQRTYPNLVSMESVRGFEYATFGQETADSLAAKSTVLPFTRNAFDPMDFTPVCFTEYDNNIRKTGNGAELAQAVLFLSGIQHYAETPEGMSTAPEYVQQLMRDIPNTWDETKFVAAWPGDYVVLARRSGKSWYVAGINAKADSLSLNLALPFLSQKSGIMVTEADRLRSFKKVEVSLDENNQLEVNLMPVGGFLAVF